MKRDAKTGARSRSMKRIAVILAGCGRADGTEITEAVSALVALSEEGANSFCFAPVMEIESAPHQRQIPVPPDQRQILEESARIARGAIRPLTQLNPNEWDGVFLPGGLGAAQN